MTDIFKLPEEIPGPFQRALKYGTLTGIVLVLLQIIMYGWVFPDDMQAAPTWFQATQYVITLGGVLMCIREYRDQDRMGDISYGKAFVTGLWTVFWISILMAVYVYGNGKLFPEKLEKFKVVATQAIEKQYDDGKLSEKQYEMSKEFTEKLMEPLWLCMITFINFLITGIIISLVGSWLHRVVFKPKVNGQNNG